MELYICQSCGHVALNKKPEQCPVCATKVFQQNDALFKESAEKSGEASVKHIPAVTVNTSCGFIPENDCVDVMVRIGATLHPMEEKHYIQFIDCYGDGTYLGRQYLTPGLNPAACFHLKAGLKTVTVIENCNIHGYWMTEQSLAG